MNRFFHRFPGVTWPFYMARCIPPVFKMLAHAGYYGLRRRELPFNPMIMHPDRNLFRELMAGRQPRIQMAIGEILAAMIAYVGDQFSRIAREPEKMVWYEDMVLPELMEAMGLVPFMVEAAAFLTPMISTGDTHTYIDTAENAGIPADVCSFTKFAMGMTMRNVLPKPAAVVTSSSPCDAGLTSYLPMEQVVNAPFYRLDIPWNVDTPEAREYVLKEMRRMIRFLEETTGVRLDMDRLKEIVEQRNRMFEDTLELWELARHTPSPVSGDVIFLECLLFLFAPGLPLGVRTAARVLDLMKANLREGVGPVKTEKHRAIMWNAAPFMFLDIFRWMEDVYETVIPMDMLTFHRNPIIDTSSERAMLLGLTEIMCKSPMARHTRGPVDNFFSDLFQLYRQYNADMIVFPAHQSCKNTRAIMGMLRDYCRRDNIPLLIIDYDIVDSRIASPDNIKKQITAFMETVMNHY